jgi:uncharacterized protein (TIGR02611 family)
LDERDCSVAAPRRVEAGRAGVAGRLSAVRERVRSVRGGAVAWRIGITLIGLAIIVVGVFLLPLPGPGWLIIFAGLGLLGTEYAWASRVLQRARRLLGRWTRWAAAQGVWVRVAVGLIGLVILAAALAGSWYLYTVV